jgi:hypothetical protein
VYIGSVRGLENVSARQFSCIERWYGDGDGGGGGGTHDDAQAVARKLEISRPQGCKGEEQNDCRDDGDSQSRD